MHHPEFKMTTDVVVLREDMDKDFHFIKGTKVLLIKRKNPPFQGSWALPGGFVNKEEHIHEAAARELQEETGLIFDPDSLEFVGIYEDPKRDERGRIVSVAYFDYVHYKEQDGAMVSCGSQGEPKANDDATELAWFDMDKLPSLAFDHGEMILAAYVKFKT